MQLSPPVGHREEARVVGLVVGVVKVAAGVGEVEAEEGVGVVEGMRAVILPFR
jgi:hypothetical protein